jgi:hypothetical protein
VTAIGWVTVTGARCHWRAHRAAKLSSMNSVRVRTQSTAGAAEYNSDGDGGALRVITYEIPLASRWCEQPCMRVLQGLVLSNREVVSDLTIAVSAFVAERRMDELGSSRPGRARR